MDRPCVLLLFHTATYTHLSLSLSVSLSLSLSLSFFLFFLSFSLLSLDLDEMQSYCVSQLLFVLAAAESKNAACVQDKWTALHWAASEGHQSVVELLLQAKADLNLGNEVFWLLVSSCLAF